MFPPGLYPALVTPFEDSGKIDWPTLLRLLAWQESQGSQGVVLSGSNGEGASLTSVERRDLVKEAKLASGRLKVILGLPTSSLEDAHWTAKQAAKAGADGILASPPSFFRRAPAEGVAQWLAQLMDASPLPVLLYHNPPVFGVPLPVDRLESLLAHPMCGGIKNSASDMDLFRWLQGRMRPDQALFVGDETLLLKAMAAGATGSISGAGNVLPLWLSQIIAAWPSEEAQAKFDLILPLLQLVRSTPQPEGHKATLHAWGLIPSPTPRLPLLPLPGRGMSDQIEALVGRPQAAL